MIYLVDEKGNRRPLAWNLKFETKHVRRKANAHGFILTEIDHQNKRATVIDEKSGQVFYMVAK